MAGQKFTLTFDAQLNIGQMKGAIGNIQSELNRLQLPQNLTKGISGTLSSLEKEIRNFEVASGKDLGNKNNFSALERSAEKIQSLFTDLQIQARDLGSSTDLSKFFPQSIVDNIQKGKQALEEYNNTLKKLEQNQARAQKNLINAQNRQTVAKGNLDAQKAELEDFQQKYESTLNQIYAKVKMNPENIFDTKSIDEAMQKVEELFAKYKNIQEGINPQTKKAYTTPTKNKYANESAELKQLIDNYRQLAAAIPEAEKAQKQLETAYTNATNKVKEMQLALDQAKTASEGGQAEAIKKVFEQLNAAGIDTSSFEQNLAGAQAALKAYAQTAEGDVTAALQKLNEAIRNNGDALAKNKADMQGASDSFRQFNDQVREVGVVKSRIQYFFGLSNAINLVKRAIRGAFSTIKELDAAMTETAVVTNYTVKDMWDQLPEYTKRANELGVMTKDAYESATLYFQQGLNADQAAALSTETLKMARIAGLDAAEATDRMTNALRGFNMELDTASAQRVDDVYSELAAISASDVDEISTAMTKVASLAHSANMEFETTAAFLAQIIETTRESAETAGTALKTVVARFSEVKKLVDTNQLKGTDEEGQVVDVNKVSQALRTAGIDLNKYFLGEVGLDDIFMELASKWDSLTNVQQRYIATQAAGSRQQSRFIALMQDYARTQELVGAAYNAEGASARQFEKTQDSLQSKLARLKNAWNEFLMGLTNNAMVKTAVDLLTNLLNFLNKLTSGFDSTTSSVLKFVAALGGFIGLKSLFSSGGLVDRGIMTLLAGTGFGNAAVKGGLLSGLGLGTGTSLVGGLSQSAQQAATGASARMPLIFGADSLLSKAGKGIWGGAQKLGAGIKGKTIMPAAWAKSLPMGAGMISETAAGLTGVATALGAVAVAVGVVIAAYQSWLRLSPEGHLKQAKQLADTMNTVAENTQKNASEFSKATENYKEYDNAVKSASTTAEYQKAVSDRTDYVAELIKTNPNIAQYVKASSKEGQFTLTINQQDLEKATEQAAKSASQAAADVSFSNALVAGKQADVYAAQLTRAGVNMERQTIFNGEGARALTGAELAKYSEIQRQIETSRAQQTAYAQQAFARQLEGSGLDDDIANLLSNALAKGFDEDEYLSKVNAQRSENWWNSQATRQQLEAQYFDLYGQQADASMKRGELARAVAQAQVNREQQQNTNAIAELVKSGAYDDILRAMAGEIDFDEKDMAAANGKLQKFADILDQDISQVEDQIKTSQKARQEIKKGRQADIFEQALKSGYNVTQQYADLIKGLDYDQLGVVSDIITQAADKVGEQTFQSLFDTLPTMSTEALQEIQTFFNSFNLDNPIQALDQLNNKIKEVGANTAFGKILADIKEANANLFTGSNLVQSFLLSESYESLGDTIEDLIKDNKQLNGKNIKDMADSCGELNTLLEELDGHFGDTINSAQALAETINLIGEGSLAIDQITDSLLAALGAGKSFESMIGDVQSWVEDFDEGTDLKFGTEHIMSQLESLGKYVDNWEFGNEPTENIYNHLFNTKEGDNAYQQLIDKYGNDFDGLENYIEGRIETLNNWSENEGLGGIQEALAKGVTGLKEISGSGGQFFDWDLRQFSSTTDAINEVADALNISQGAAEAFILSWQTHIPKLRTEWNDLQFKDAIGAFARDLGDSTVITQQELDALAAQFGKEATEIKAAIDKVRAAAGQPITVSVNWQDEKGGNLSGQDLIDKFNQTVGTAREDRIGRAKPLVDYSKFLSDIDDVSRTVQTELGATLNTLDFDTLHNHLVNALKLTPAQATEIADHISEQTGQKLSKEIKVPVKLDDGTIGTETQVITATTSESLQAGIDAAMQAANYALVAEQMADASDFSTVGSKLEAAIKTGADTLPGAVSSAAEGVSITIPVTYEAQNPEVLTGQGATGGIVVGVAKGGRVKSYASGSAANRLSPGVALTGEEGPEIVWNKDKGYAYITGEQHPEFQNLRPGDRVFNASETKKILNGAAKGGIIDSYASGGWKPGNSGKNSGGGGGGGSGSGGDKTPEEWKNDLDWLYNLMEDIAELERDQKAIEENYEDLLQDQTKTGKDLYNLLIKQLGNLYTQLDHQTFALEKREQEMREFMDVTNDQDQYLWYNWQDRTLEIDWDAIDQITDEEQYKHVKELVDEAEEIQDKIDDADDAIMDITNQIQELENIWRDTFTDFEDRVYDALVKSYQQVIDKYSELNDTLNNSNSQILDSLQRQISLERQIRDNTKTEEEITDDEARLAYLRRDTSGGNELAALQLERELADQRESYEDTLVDQAISRLQEDNDAAAQQRQQQIDIMQAQLDYQSQNGEFNAAVRELLETAMGADGELLTNSDLANLLKEQENWAAMSDVSKTVWEEELNGTFKEVAAFLLKENAEQNGTFYTALTAAVNSVSSAIGSYSQAMVKLGNSISSAGSSGGGGGGGGGDSGGSKPPQSKSVYHTVYRMVNGTPKYYATGGLNTQTGPAWLDGTPSEPEYVLNARQTDAFLRLADVLPSMINTNTAGAQTNTFGSTYVNLSVNLDSVSPEYDVDRMIDMLKDRLYDAGSYRNVNSLSFIR